jgi:hypothetical protein
MPSLAKATMKLFARNEVEIRIMAYCCISRSWQDGCCVTRFFDLCQLAVKLFRAIGALRARRKPEGERGMKGRSK